MPNDTSVSQGTDPGEVVNLSARRKPVHYTISITQHWDGRVEAWVHDVADDARSRRAVADCMERVAAMWDVRAARPGETEPEWDRTEAINAWGRVTAELGLPWSASASRVLEVIRNGK